MEPIFTVAQAKAALKKSGVITTNLEVHASLRPITMSSLSRAIGFTDTNLHKRMKSGDMPVSYLIALSTQLNVNFFPAFSPFVQEGIRLSPTEKSMQSEIEKLRTENEMLTREVAFLKEVLRK